ncbi:MAG TPA: biotin/lipoyl-containing protein, partial [Thermoanaerobaculia bacterium]|nr:biotin/lipoyl-containing protein [Thermoanaerobaculia bacterium]
MATEVVMPQMGESIAEGTITKWLVKPGDRVERDQPLFEISTDKVDAEIPSPASGTLLEVRHDEGETVAVDAVVALIGEPGEEGAEAAAGAERAAPEDAEGEEPAARAEEPEAVEGAEEEKAASRGEEPEEERRAEAEAADETEGAEGEKRAEEADGAERAEEAEEAEEAPRSEEERVRLFSSPVVRKIAEEEGVDIAEVEGTGAQGRVTKKDILGFLDERRRRPAEEKPAAATGKPAAERRPAAPARPAERPAAGAAALLPG